MGNSYIIDGGRNAALKGAKNEKQKKRKYADCSSNGAGILSGCSSYIRYTKSLCCIFEGNLKAVGKVGKLPISIVLGKLPIILIAEYREAKG